MAQEKLTPQEKEVHETGEKLVSLAHKVREISRDRQVKEKIFPIVEKIDQSAALQKFRAFWDRVPHAMQWAIVYMPSAMPNIPGETIKLLIELGLVEYKGGTSEKDIKSRNEWESRKREWTVKIGALFLPELRPIIPLLKPIEEIEGIKQDILTDIRFHVREQRLKRADMKKVAEIKRELGLAA